MNPALSQSCIDEDGDGWGWNPDTNQSCQVSPSNGDTTPKTDSANLTGGLKVTWSANDATQNVSQYEVAGKVNSGNERSLFRGTATEFIVRLADIPATFNDRVCVRVRAIRTTTVDSAQRDTFSEWSVENCISLPDAPLLPPQLIEVSVVE